MNSTLNPQSEVSELARVQFAETVEAETALPCDNATALRLWYFTRTQRNRILARLESERASVAGKLANARAWQLAETIGQEIAGKLTALRQRQAIIDRI